MNKFYTQYCCKCEIRDNLIEMEESEVVDDYNITYIVHTCPMCGHEMEETFDEVEF